MVNIWTKIAADHPESWWQTYLKANILLMQQGYIKAIEKLNVAIGDMRFPDFLLVTHDNYLDVLEIKNPNTPILKAEPNRGNYYFDAEMSKAVIQTENYLNYIGKQQDALRTHLKDHDIEIRAARPRGIILAGDNRNLRLPKEHFRTHLYFLERIFIFFAQHTDTAQGLVLRSNRNCPCLIF